MPLVIRTTGLQEFLDANSEPTIKQLTLGEPGSGKTRSASFWPAPILLDCEHGRMSVADRQIPFVEINTTADMDAIITRLEMEARQPPAQRQFKTAIVDTIDSLQSQVIIPEILKAGRKEALSGFADWGQLDAKMSNFIGRLMKLPMNVIFNCHVKPTKDGEDGPIVYAPKLKGDIRDQLPGYFDLVGHMATSYQAIEGQRKLVRHITWAQSPAWPMLKDRSGQLPDVTPVTFTEDDYLQLFERIFGGPGFEALKESGELETLTTDDDAEITEPHPGGPVEVKKPVRKAAAKKKAEPEPQAEPAPKIKEPVAAAREQAVATVTATLGGTVVEDRPLAPEPPKAEPPKAEPIAGASTGVICGTPTPDGIAAKVTPANGCGRELTGLDPNMLSIARFKTKTNLCPDCLKAWRTSTSR